MFTGWAHATFIGKTNPGKHKLGLEMQSMMLPKHKNHTWPSPSPAQHFEEVAATEWLFYAWGKHTMNNGWLSLLAGKPGAVLAHQPTARLMLVIATAQYGFLAWGMEVKIGLQLICNYVVCRGRGSCATGHRNLLLLCSLLYVFCNGLPKLYSKVWGEILLRSSRQISFELGVHSGA
jgi:hypothetical protein